MNYVEQIVVFLFIIGIILFLVTMIVSKYNHNVPTLKGVKNPRFAILIPARDESMVIRGLLDSLKRQTFSIHMKDVYIIVEGVDDPTVMIAKEYGVTVVLRKHLNLKRKGYALDEGIKYILEHDKHYDAYFVIDADNILDENYLYEMVKVYDMGYDVGSCYRNCKNGNDNIISGCSSIIFSFINSVGNEFKNKHDQNIIAIGSGFYIRGEWIEKWNGYPFHLLAEDYEFSLYATLNEMTTYYNKKAILYDEQPTTYKETVLQRVRWIRGYFDARRKYVLKLKKKIRKNCKNKGSIFGALIGVIPYIFMVVGVITYLLLQIVAMIINVIFKMDFSKIALIKLISILGFIYLTLFLLTFIILIKEWNQINLSNRMKCYCLFVHPFYLITYIPCALKAILKKYISWEKIEHKRKEIVKE